jgi:epoxyqueuosine reductase
METDDLKTTARDFDLVGVADPFCPGLQRAPEGHKPQDYLPGVKAVISLGLQVIDTVLQTTPSNIYSKHYDTINTRLNSGAYEVTRWLEKHGFPSMTFPETDGYPILWEQYNKGLTGFVPCFNHMAAAVASGLGLMGDCGVVLTPQYGPRQRWVSIVTTAPFSLNTPLETEICLSKLGQTCGKCAQACTIHAISDKGTDVRRCWVHWTDLRDKGLACGLCIKACPVGK